MAAWSAWIMDVHGVPPLRREIQEYGLGVSAAASREQFMYRVDALRGRLEESVELLADTVINPLFKDSEIEDAKRVAEFQHMDVAMNPQVVIQDVRYSRALLGWPPTATAVVRDHAFLRTHTRPFTKLHLARTRLWAAPPCAP